MEYLLAFAIGLLMGWVLSKYIKYYPNLDRIVIIATSGVLFALSWFIHLPYILTTLTAIFYIGMLLILWILQKKEEQ